ncbi:MAG TPA: hypothetical protein VMU94_02180 [Streptosporangiaceae bacterium]|nr:hypothetical protein [Streptosporangiaceae bacterium]
MAVPATRLLVLHPELRARSDLLLYARRWITGVCGPPWKAAGKLRAARH